MKTHLKILFITACYSLFSQSTPYHNTKKFSQITGLPGGELSNLWGYTAPDGKEYALVGSQTATSIYDVSNCGSPVLKNTFVDGSNTFWREYKTYKKFGYMVTEAGGEGLEMFDMTNTNSIVFSQKAAPADANFFYSAHTLSVDTINARMYVSGVRQTSGGASNWLNIYQLSPTNIVPTLLKKIQLNTVSGAPALNLYIHDLYVENNIIYCSHGPDGFGIWDCTDPNNIVFLGIKDDSPGYNHSSWRHPFFPQYFYCAEETAGQPMITYNVTTGSSYTIGVTNTFKNPLLAPTFTNNIYHNPHMVGNALYISAYNDGVQLYDMSDPVRPIRVAFYDSYTSNTNYSSSFLGAWGVYPFFSSGCICVSDINSGFHTFKTHFPKVEITGNIHLPEAGKGIVFRDSSNTYKLLSVNNAGAITTAPITITQAEHKVDSADFEFKTLTGKIYLTSINGTKYEVSLTNVGTMTTTVISPSAITNALTINGHLVIDNRYKGVIMRSPNNQRWKFGVNAAGNFTSYKTAF